LELGLQRDTSSGETYGQEFRRGLLSVAPFCIGIVPFSIAFAMAARSAGFTPLEIQALSMFVFAGAAQLAAVSMYAAGAGIAAIVLTTLIINLRHIIYGLSLNHELPERTRPPRPVLAFLMVDETYGLAMSERLAGRGGVAFFFGAGLGFYVVFALSTFVGIVLGELVPDVDRLGLLFIFPLVFVALLLPLIANWRHLTVAIFSAGIALVMTQFGVSGLTILVATIGGATLGTMLEAKTCSPSR
jgi:4-azaleucine resistance transporter AzlC